MFDIHYHLLYGLDDGPKTLEDSIALAEASVAEGTTHIVATPHSNYRYKFDPEVNRQRLEELSAAFDGRLTLGLGCDMHLTYENVQEAIRDPKKFSINGGRYVLVEFADSSLPRQMDDTLFQLRLAGIVPIITHPERNPMLMSAPNRLADWVQKGCVVQVTAASLTGRFGPKSQKLAENWIAANWVHLLASDAHGVKWRSPSMGEGYEAAKTKFSAVTADRLCIQNPKAIFYNQQLPPQPEPEQVGAPGPGLGFFKRLFGGSGPD